MLPVWHLKSQVSRGAWQALLHWWRLWNHSWTTLLSLPNAVSSPATINREVAEKCQAQVSVNEANGPKLTRRHASCKLMSCCLSRQASPTQQWLPCQREPGYLQPHTLPASPRRYHDNRKSPGWSRLRLRKQLNTPLKHVPPAILVMQSWMRTVRSLLCFYFVAHKFFHSLPFISQPGFCHLAAFTAKFLRSSRSSGFLILQLCFCLTLFLPDICL